MPNQIVKLLLTLLIITSFITTCSLESAGNDDVFQEIVYVSTSGSDTNDGTKDSPVATLSKGLEILLADDLKELRIASGHYIVDSELLINRDHIDISGNYDESFSNNSGETILDGNGNNKIFIINNSSEITLKNMTISNADGYDGGGVVIHTSIKQSISNLKFIDNEAVNGAAISLYDSSTEIEDCEFHSNQTSSSGGAIHLVDGTLNIRSCDFIENDADGWGGAIFSEESAELNIDASYFESNYATGHGGAIRIRDGAIVINNTEFIKNNSDGDFNNGGALSVLDSSATITSNTFSENEVPSGVPNPGNGGALHIQATNESILVSNNLIGGFNSGYSAVFILYPDENDMEFVDNTITYNKGVGIHISHASPSFGNNIVSHNTDHGIEVYDSGVVFDNDIIRYHNNYGLYVRSGDVPDTSSVTFTQNSAGNIGP